MIDKRLPFCSGLMKILLSSGTQQSLALNQVGLNRRSLAETTMVRFKQIFGGRLSAIVFERQCTEAFIKRNALNKMTALGIPDSYVLA
jgi:hypothetical protein